MVLSKRVPSKQARRWRTLIWVERGLQDDRALIIPGVESADH